MSQSDLTTAAAMGFAGGASVATLAAVASNVPAQATLAAELEMVGIVVDGRPQEMPFGGPVQHPVAADVPVGDFVLLGIIANPITNVVSVTDTAGNQYNVLPNPVQAQIGSLTGGEGSALGVAWARITHPLRAGVDKISVVYTADTTIYFMHGPRSVCVMGVNYRGCSGMTPAVWTARQSNPDPNNDFHFAEATQADSGQVAATSDPMIVIGLGQGLAANITTGQVQSIAYASRPWELILENSVEFRTFHAPIEGTPIENSDGGRRYVSVAFQIASRGDVLRFAAQEAVAGAEALLVGFRVPGAPEHPLEVRTLANVRTPRSSRDVNSSAAVILRPRRSLTTTAAVALHSASAGGDLDVHTLAAVE